MDEEAERAKLSLLDLTEDVIELILEKKRKTYANRALELHSPKEGPPVIQIVEEIPDEIEVIEPTFYPPNEETKTEPTPQLPPTKSRWGWFVKKHMGR